MNQYRYLAKTMLGVLIAVAISANHSEAAFKTDVGGVSVSYSGEGSAYYDETDGTLTIAIESSGGSLKVTVGPTASANWGSFVDIYLLADAANLKSISIKGSAVCTPFVCGQVNFVAKFSLMGGVVGDTDFYGVDFGLGMVADAVPASANLKSSYTTAQLFGYAYPPPSASQALTQKSVAAPKRQLIDKIQAQLR